MSRAASAVAGAKGSSDARNVQIRDARDPATFTEVRAFGGGCVPFLNGILHLTAVPECAITGLFGSTLVEQGATLDVTGLAPGIHRFECLIHPWMRTTVTVG